MLNKIKHTVKHTVIYSLGNLSTKLVGFILLPLYTGYLSVSEYGMLAILEVSTQFMVAVFAFSLPTALMRWCAAEKNEKVQGSIVFTTLFFSIIIVIALNLVLTPFKSYFAQYFFSNEQYAEYFTIIFLNMAVSIVNSVILNFIRIKEKSVFYVILTTLKIIVILTLNIFFIVKLGWGVKGILLGQLGGHLFLFLLSIPFMIKYSVPSIKPHIFKNMFYYGVPLVFSTLSTMVLTLGDRYIIKYYLPYSAVGVYSLGYKIASILNVFLLQSFQMGFLPVAYKIVGKPDSHRFLSKALTYFTFIMMFAGLALSLFSRELIVTFSERREYWIASAIVPLIVLSFVLKGIQYNFSLGTHYTKKTKYNAYIVTSGAILNIILNFLLIPHWGIYGAAITTNFTILLMIVLFYIRSQKLIYIPYELRKLITILFTGIGLYIISIFNINSNFWVTILIKVGLLFSFPILLYFFKFYEPIELLRLQQSWRKWRNPKNWKQNLSKIKLQ